VLRSDGNVPAARQVAARVSAAIAREPLRAAALARLPDRESLRRALAGFAIAAGVAVGAVLLVQQVTGPGADAPEAIVAQAEVPPVQPVADDAAPDDGMADSYVTPPATDAAGGIPPVDLANYLVAHYGYASPLVRRSVGAGLISDDDRGLAAEALRAEQGAK
jgi:hypothetical protein